MILLPAVMRCLPLAMAASQVCPFGWLLTCDGNTTADRLKDPVAMKTMALAKNFCIIVGYLRKWLTLLTTPCPLILPTHGVALLNWMNERSFFFSVCLLSEKGIWRSLNLHRSLIPTSLGSRSRRKTVSTIKSFFTPIWKNLHTRKIILHSRLGVDCASCQTQQHANDDGDANFLPAHGFLLLLHFLRH